MPPRVSLAAGLLLAVLAGACGSGSGSSSTATPSLDGTSWALASVGGATAQPGGALGFSGGKLSGSTGCNTFGGAYTQSGSALTLTLGATTMMACPPPYDAQEHAVLAALPKTASFTDQGGTLTLLDGSGTTLLTYTHAAPVSLAGPKWEVTGINNGKNAVSSVVAGTTVTATFGPDGTVSGSAGCNSYSAGYTLSGTALKVDHAAATQMFCDSPAGVMDQETAFLNALAASTVVETSASGVTLRDASGATQLTLAKSAG